MKDFKETIKGLEIEELNIGEMAISSDMEEQDVEQIMGSSCTTCTCTCSCCTT